MSILSMLFGNYNNNKATSAINKGNQQGIDTIGKYYEEGKGYTQPFWNTGSQAAGQQSQLLNGDLTSFYNSPDFQGRLKAGGQMFDSSAAARGGVFGGGATRGREMFAQDLAQQGLGDYRNWLGQMSGQGLQAGAINSAAGAAAGQNISSLYQDMGANTANKYAQRGQNFNNFENSLFKIMGLG